MASLPVDDPIILFYNRAIAAMKARPITDPISWRAQAAIHGYQGTDDPSARPGEAMPSSTHQDDFWEQCQHGSWFFLPWHRMYLHHFERIVMGHVARLGGPADWALPYWNYSASTAAARLPLPFQSAFAVLPDGQVSELLVTERDPRANAGLDFAAASDTDLSVCLRAPRFVGTGASAFGGPRTPFQHLPAGFGALEDVPHNQIHRAVAGAAPGGFMGTFTRAPLDPIFWLHHCNIDRLWEVWLRRDPSHRNPTDRRWLTNISFRFHNASGNPVRMRCSDVVDTKTSPLEYEYDDTSDPLP